MVAAARATLALTAVARWTGRVLSCKGTIPSQNRVFSEGSITYDSTICTACQPNEVNAPGHG